MLASQTRSPEKEFIHVILVVSCLLFLCQFPKLPHSLFCAASPPRPTHLAIDVACQHWILAPRIANGTLGDVQNSNRAQIRLPGPRCDPSVHLLEAKTAPKAVSPTIPTLRSPDPEPHRQPPITRKQPGNRITRTAPACLSIRERADLLPAQWR